MSIETMGTANGQGGALPDGTNPDVSQEEQREVQKITREFFRYKKYRARYDKNWMDYYKLFRGVQWSSRRPHWKSSESINFIWQQIQSQIPLQTDVRPKWEFLPREPSDTEFAEVLESVSNADFDQKNWMMPLLEILYDGWIYGTGFGRMDYDPTEDFGIGAAVFASMDPFYCYPEPGACDINTPDSEGFFYARPAETKKLRAEHPDKAEQIKPDVTDWVRRERTDLKDFKLTYFNSDKQLPEGTFGSLVDESKTDMTFVIEWYAKPKETVEEDFDEEGPDGELVKKFRIKRKWPKGRHVKIANGMFLVNEELPYEDGEIPCGRFVNYVLPREFFGVSDVEPIEGIQRIFNKLVCFAIDALALMGNPVWVVDTNADVDTDSGFVNVPGSIIEKNPETEVRREQGVGLAPGALAIIDRIESWINKIAGVSDLQSGEAPGGVTAASAIEQLIAIQRTRVRQKQRNLDAFLKDMGRLYMNRVFQFYSVPKIFRITNDDGSILFRKFRIDEQADEEGRILRVAVYQDTEKDEETGEMVEHSEKRLIIKGEFDISVKSGSSLPFEIADIERKSLALFDRGIIDEEEVLERLDVPNREKILTRLEERRAAAAEAAAQEQAQKAG